MISGALPDPVRFQPERPQATPSAGHHEAADARAEVEDPRIRRNRKVWLDLAQRSFRIAMDKIFDDLSLSCLRLNPVPVLAAVLEKQRAQLRVR